MSDLVYSTRSNGIFRAAAALVWMIFIAFIIAFTIVFGFGYDGFVGQ